MVREINNKGRPIQNKIINVSQSHKMTKILLKQTSVTWIEGSLRGLYIYNQIMCLFSRMVKFVFPTLPRDRTVRRTSFPPNTTCIHHFLKSASLVVTRQNRVNPLEKRCEDLKLLRCLISKS